MAAALLDMKIIKHSEGNKNLDDLLRLLYDEYYIKKKRGFTEKEFKEAAEKVAGVALDDFFDTIINSTANPDFNLYLQPLGYEFEMKALQGGFLGLNTNFKNGKTEVSNVLRNGPAFQAGISKGDIIVSVNGKVPSENFAEILKEIQVQDKVVLVIQRESATQIMNLVALRNPFKQVKINLKEGNQEKALWPVMK
jgi:predicted metalloprotease with PDZ domain